METSEEACAFCGHDRKHHIYHEGACRPGFICEAECGVFVPQQKERIARALQLPRRVNGHGERMVVS